MNFSFHPEAKNEFNEAIEYYENCEPGLGYDFSIEVLATIQNIVNYPTYVANHRRRCPALSCKPFPVRHYLQY